MAEKTAYTTIDEYIAGFPPDVRERLAKMRAAIRKAAPDAKERMSWQMPTFWQGENLVHFAAHKTHIGFYPASSGIAAFKNQLSEYKTSKGAVQFPFSQPVPYGLVEEITRFRVSEALAK
ncbi:DUF1801 domain-containing protein [Christensenellaceae bacterium OttesenSCG-928-K19]|nr:DUF1801 domain-containing protein [Christensenellaceae bacterium OttesenSCG-928-K19]